MAKTKKPAAKKTIIDVSHPGESAPSANSKSVIVSNRPILKDPMMVDDTTAQDDNSNSSLAATSNESTIKPLTAPLLTSVKPAKTAVELEKTEPAAAEPEAPAESVKPEEPVAAETAAKADEKVTDETEKPQPDEPKAGKPEEPEAKETPVTPKDKTKPEPAESPETKQETQRQAALDKLTDSKEYYLPINAVEKRRSRRFVGLGILLSLLLALAWADVALDAGLIHLNGVKPVTHFFSN
jgi:hypothetical protein